MIVKHGLKGISTKPKEVLGSFEPGGFSSKTSFYLQSVEEIKIRFHNKQNLFFVLLILIKKTIIFLYKKIND